MEMQMAFNIALGIAGCLVGWLIKAMQDGIKANGEKIQAIEVMVAGRYATTAHIDKLMDAVFAQLRRIEDKLDEKADK